MPSLIVANGQRHAETTAKIDWGWKQVGRNVFETPDGERVTYVPEHCLRGYERGTKLYMLIRLPHTNAETY